jgi:acyl dehydratase
MSHRITDAMVAFVEQGCRFLAPVFVGEVVTPHFTVASVEARTGKGSAFVRFEVSLIKGDGTVVLEGHHTYLLLLRAADTAPDKGHAA